MKIDRYKRLPELDPSKLSREKYTLLFETGYADKANRKSYLFSRPHYVIRAYDHTGLIRAFRKIEEYSKKYYLAGYLAYEAGYYFEEDIFLPEKTSKTPLLEFFVYKKAAYFDHISGKSKNLRQFLLTKSKKIENVCSVEKPQIGINYGSYKKQINRIKNYIRKGDTYQVNFTDKIHFKFKGNSYDLYNELKNKQRVSYGAYLNLDQSKILSLSPELYFSLKDGVLTAKPMKGTIDRGKDIFEDRKRIRELKYSIKNRAENIMIVDMIRNDLGRICINGSVKTSKIFEVEKYNTLFQLVTTVCGKLFPGTSYYDIFKSIFPGGSITGAPKIRTMEIIRMLEKNKRRIYCGALGIIFPGKKRAVFNIPIRTVQIERSCGEMGIGGGIVWDSSPKSEYQEALLKSKFLTVKPAEFCLLETILWKNKYFLLAGHLSRLKASAEYFSFPLALDKIKKKLKEKENRFEKHLAYKIRLFVSKTGAVNLEAAVIQKENTAKKILISSICVNSKDPYLYHKTTKRSLYDTERGRYVKGDILDVLFLNENNEITEGAISNIFIAKKGRYYTPPVSSGLLPGVYRSYYIKKTAALEKPLFLDDLKTADKIILTNSVRGASRVTLV